jgi:hypothetical protein
MMYCQNKRITLSYRVKAILYDDLNTDYRTAGYIFKELVTYNATNT